MNQNLPSSFPPPHSKPPFLFAGRRDYLYKLYRKGVLSFQSPTLETVPERRHFKYIKLRASIGLKSNHACYPYKNILLMNLSFQFISIKKDKSLGTPPPFEKYKEQPVHYSSARDYVLLIKLQFKRKYVYIYIYIFIALRN